MLVSMSSVMRFNAMCAWCMTTHSTHSIQTLPSCFASSTPLACRKVWPMTNKMRPPWEETGTERKTGTDVRGPGGWMTLNVSLLVAMPHSCGSMSSWETHVLGFGGHVCAVSIGCVVHVPNKSAVTLQRSLCYQGGKLNMHFLAHRSFCPSQEP